MFKYFPTPYPGETIYSILARYIDQYCMSTRNLKDELENDSGYIRINPIIGIQLDKLFCELPYFYEYDANYFIDKHTIVPVYKAFLYKHEYENLRNNVIYDLKGAMQTITKCWSREIRYCRKCIEEDREKYGEAYLHREHQLKGILFCYKHSYGLDSILINKDELININSIEINEPNNITQQMTAKEKEIGLKVVEDFNYLLREGHKINNLDNIQVDFFKELKENMSFYYEGKFNWKEISDALFEVCSLEILSNVCGNKVYESEKKFIYTLSRRSRIKNPILGLWLINALLDKSIGFICEYQNSIDIDYELVKLEKYREQFRKEILLIKDKNPNIAKYEVKKKLWREYYWLSKNDRDWLKEQLNTDEKRINQIEQLAERHINRIQSFIKDNPKAKRSEIKLKNSQSYGWLREYKSDILEKILPPSKRAIRNKEELFDKHSKAVYKVLNEYPEANITTIRKKSYGAYQWFKKNNALWLYDRLNEHRREYYYKSILKTIEEPDVTISKLRKRKGEAYKWIETNDSEWLEEIISIHKLK